MTMLLPRYPIYVPSKGRYDSAYTMKFLIKDAVPFNIVVEPKEHDVYADRFGHAANILVLPWDNPAGTPDGLIKARNWIKDHATAAGAERHWQLDDNMLCVKRRYKGRRIVCDSGPAFAACEDFVDRYKNIAIAGMNYEMFLPNGGTPPPFHLNAHVYSCTLVNNSIPHRWRLNYNDDTDMCLQVLADGWCTILFNAFLVFKMKTMKVKGGNTDALYRGDGRLKMARSLERVWPGVVTVDRRFHRPQHVIKDAWRKFDTQLILKDGLNLSDFAKTNEYGLDLKELSPVKHDGLKKLVADYRKKADS